MKKILYTTLCIALIFIGCEEEKNPVEPDPISETIIADNTIQADSNNFKASLLSIDSTQIIYGNNTSFTQALKVGGFIVSDYREGILRKVESIKTQGNQVIIKTGQARLDEVIIKGKIKFSGPINPQEMILESTSHNNFRIEKTQTDLFVSFNDVTFSGANNLRINASTTFSNHNLTFIVEFDHGVTLFQTYLEVTNESTIEVNTTGNVSVSGELTPPWAQFILPPIPTPLIIPVVPKIQFGIGGDINIEQISTNTLSSTTTTKAGFQLVNFSPSPIFEFNTNVYATSNLEHLGANFKNYLIFPKVGFYVVGLLGPFYSQQVYAQGSVSQDNVGKYVRISWGLQGDGGVEFDLFGLLQAGLSFQLFDTDWEIWKNYLTSNPPNPPTLLSPANGAPNISIPATLSWNPSSGATSYALQVSTSSNFTSFVYNQSGLTGTSQQVGGLNNNTIYYWRVSATNNYGTSSWSSVWNFTTTGPVSGKKMLYLKYGDPSNWTIPGASGSQAEEISRWENAGFDVTTMDLSSTTITSSLLNSYDILRLYSYKGRGYTANESNAISNFVTIGGNLIADIPHTSDVSAVSFFGVDNIVGNNGGSNGLEWFYHGAPYVFGPITGPTGTLSTMAIECMDRPVLKSNHSLIIDATVEGYPAIAHGSFGSGKIVLMFVVSWSHDATYPGNAYRANIYQEQNLQFLQNCIIYFN